MGIKYCLQSLKTSVRRLRALEKLATKSGNYDLHTAIDDIAFTALYTACPLIKKLGDIYAGKPLEPNHPSKGMTLGQFKKAILGPSGLKHHLPHATDEQMFNTWRAMGLQSFTVFEMHVHRVVMGIEMELKDLEANLVDESPDENVGQASGEDVDMA